MPDSAPGSGQDAAAVREFFDQWQIYQKVTGCNYLYHREAFAALGRALERRKEPISFLDLGSGDASWTAGVLSKRQVSRYRAVDLSPVALDLARKNLAECPWESRFEQADFFQFIQSNEETFDVIFIGLSLHHLPLADKKVFFSQARKRLTPGGSLICYEPILGRNETRDEVLSRWWQWAEVDWSELTAEELAAVKAHVFGNDHPETIDAFAEMATQAGLKAPEILFQDSRDLYALMEFRT